MVDEANPDGGGELQVHTVRLELIDQPGELLVALRPIAENGGNLMSIFHERGSLTPRGHIPVEVTLECLPEQFSTIIDALKEAGVNVVQAGTERYSEEVTLLLLGHLIDSDLSNTLQRIESYAGASVVDFSLSTHEGLDDESSARLRLAVQSGRVDEALDAVGEIADEKGLSVVEPLAAREVVDA